VISRSPLSESDHQCACPLGTPFSRRRWSSSSVKLRLTHLEYIVHRISCRHDNSTLYPQVSSFVLEVVYSFAVFSRLLTGVLRWLSSCLSTSLESESAPLRPSFEDKRDVSQTRCFKSFRPTKTSLGFCRDNVLIYLRFTYVQHRSSQVHSISL
jgi:hypothetical protein